MIHYIFQKQYMVKHKALKSQLRGRSAALIVLVMECFGQSASYKNKESSQLAVCSEQRVAVSTPTPLKFSSKLPEGS